MSVNGSVQSEVTEWELPSGENGDAGAIADGLDGVHVSGSAELLVKDGPDATKETKALCAKALQVGIEDGKRLVPFDSGLAAVIKETKYRQTAQNGKLQEKQLELTRSKRRLQEELELQKSRRASNDSALKETQDYLIRLKAQKHDWAESAICFQKEVAEKRRKEAENPEWVDPMTGLLPDATQPSLVTFLGGLLFLLGAIVFIVTEVHLSISAVRALGFLGEAKGEGDWADLLFSPDMWLANAGALLVCFGIGFMTLVFKLAYDEWRFGRKKDLEKMKRILIGLVSLGGVTVLVLGLARTLYLMPEDGSNVFRVISFFGLLMPMLAFPPFGAVLLSEGLQRIAHTSIGLFRWVFRSQSNDEEYTRPRLLTDEMSQVEELVASLEKEASQNGDRRVALVAKEAVVKARLDTQGAALTDLSKRQGLEIEMVERHYGHGYALGKLECSKKGAFEVLRTLLVERGLVNEIELNPK